MPIGGFEQNRCDSKKIKEKEMKKEYEKPKARLEIFELNEFIAGDCAAAGGIIVNIATAAGCSKTNASVDWYYNTMGLFGNSCTDIPEPSSSEGICYHTPSGNALPTFSS